MLRFSRYIEVALLIAGIALILAGLVLFVYRRIWTKSQNPTHGSGWMVQVLPTAKATKKYAHLPRLAVMEQLNHELRQAPNIPGGALL